MRGTATFALVAVVVVVLRAQQPAEQSAAAVRAAPDLQAVLWASEPAVTNPTNITVDDRGRVWVLEAVNYRRTTRSQPDIQASGDRIVILEDADRDGKAERVKVFDQNPAIRAPLGIAVLGDKVYVYTKDADDRIVSKEVLLTGFGGEDHDHGLHAVVFGPDGKLYFNHGNTASVIPNDLNEPGTREAIETTEFLDGRT
jgi:putative membrane-bound dehydrogenase-like protein